MVAGERDAAVMADLAHSKLRRKIPDLTEALTGHFDDHHAIIVGQLLDRLAYTERAIAAVDAELGARMQPYARQLEPLKTIPGVGLGAAQVFIAETGGDMSRFGTPNASQPGPGSRPRSTSPPADDTPPAPDRATSG